MSRNALINDTQIVKFSKKYIPIELSLRPFLEGENPFSAIYELGPKDNQIHTSFFREASLRLPLWPLLIDFLRCTLLTLSQLSPM